MPLRNLEGQATVKPLLKTGPSLTERPRSLGAVDYPLRLKSSDSRLVGDNLDGLLVADNPYGKIRRCYEQCYNTLAGTIPNHSDGTSDILNHSDGTKDIPNHSDGTRDLPNNSTKDILNNSDGTKDILNHSDGTRDIPNHSDGTKDSILSDVTINDLPDASCRPDGNQMAVTNPAFLPTDPTVRDGNPVTPPRRRSKSLSHRSLEFNSAKVG